ncbi:uncharacterized protein LOC123258734 [Cotesia glomerata]|uniref:uncharacterized protein LOC123258734 n=1 Tax=Cotesia glomerata TaxID=32391 RepID=UPI001D022523|nr:uncharacterized protein LOC123258734 [Cotesia glomerata]
MFLRHPTSLNLFLVLSSLGGDRWWEVILTCLQISVLCLQLLQSVVQFKKNLCLLLKIFKIVYSTENQLNNSKMDLSAINKINNLPNFLPTKKFEELHLNKIYQITEIKKVNTKYGPKILGIVKNEFSIFFPNRTNRKLIDDEEQLTSLIDLASAGELHLNYFGTAYHKFEFLIKPS